MKMIRGAKYAEKPLNPKVEPSKRCNSQHISKGWMNRGKVVMLIEVDECTNKTGA